MSCKQIEESLSAYLDDALSAEERQEIESHLQNCPACQKAYDELKQTVMMLSSLDDETPPASFRREIYDKLQKEQVSQKKSPLYRRAFDRFKTLNRYQLIPAAAVLVVVLIALPVLMDSVDLGVSKKAEYSMANQTKESLRATDSITGSGFGATEEKLKQAPDAAPVARDTMLSAPQASGMSTQFSFDRKIIKNADMHLEVENFEAAVTGIKDRVAAAGGYIANESGSSSGSEAIRNGHLQVRVPEAQFDSFLVGMESLGKLKSRNIYSQDVTEEYVDVEGRLKAMRTKEERLLAILSSSGKLSDILAVENELASTRAELESLEGRLRYLNSRTDFSNIDISISQVALSQQQISTGGLAGLLIKAKEAFILAVNNIIKSAGRFVIGLSSALPYLVLVFLAGYVLWRIIRKILP